MIRRMSGKAMPQNGLSHCRRSPQNEYTENMMDYMAVNKLFNIFTEYLWSPQLLIINMFRIFMVSPNQINKNRPPWIPRHDHASTLLACHPPTDLLGKTHGKKSHHFENIKKGRLKHGFFWFQMSFHGYLSFKSFDGYFIPNVICHGLNRFFPLKQLPFDGYSQVQTQPSPHWGTNGGPRRVAQSVARTFSQSMCSSMEQKAERTSGNMQ